MSKACIVRKNTPGSDRYQVIISHEHGDPDSLGRILKRHFRQEVAIEELLNGGDAAYIHPATGKVVRNKKCGVSCRIIPAYMLQQTCRAHQIDFIYIYDRGAWTTVNIRGEKIELS